MMEFWLFIDAAGAADRKTSVLSTALLGFSTSDLPVGSHFPLTFLGGATLDQPPRRPCRQAIPVSAGTTSNRSATSP
jgi:hypothetical protein